MKISDTRFFHKDSYPVWLSWLGAWSAPVKRFFFVGRDMTESRKTQEALRESEQLARGIINSAPDAFVQADQRGVIRDWNPQAEALFGWSRDEALGKNVFDLLGRPDGGIDIGEISRPLLPVKLHQGNRIVAPERQIGRAHV